eukprot:6490433-Amphidinium_carterae.2
MGCMPSWVAVAKTVGRRVSRVAFARRALRMAGEETSSWSWAFEKAEVIKHPDVSLGYSAPLCVGVRDDSDPLHVRREGGMGLEGVKSDPSVVVTVERHIHTPSLEEANVVRGVFGIGVYRGSLIGNYRDGGEVLNPRRVTDPVDKKGGEIWLLSLEAFDGLKTMCREQVEQTGSGGRIRGSWGGSNVRKRIKRDRDAVIRASIEKRGSIVTLADADGVVLQHTSTKLWWLPGRGSSLGRSCEVQVATL